MPEHHQRVVVTINPFLSMRAILFLIIPVMIVSFNRSTHNPFLKLKYDKVVFYDFEEIGAKGGMIVGKNGTYLQRIVKQIQVDSITTKKLNTRLGEKKSFGNVTAFCFEPHCGFVYFLKDKPVAQISICLECNRLLSTVDIPAQKQGKVGEGANAYYLADGMSKSLRKFINELLKKNKFSHQIEPGSAFDE